MSNKRTPIGRFIHSSWGNMNVRAGKYRHLQTKNKNKTYEDIEVLITYQEFKKWCINRIDLILSVNRPSIDRIDKNNHYSLDNIQVLALEDNIAKDRMKHIDGRCVCFRCKIEKITEEFVKDSRRRNGRSTICKICDSERKKK